MNESSIESCPGVEDETALKEAVFTIAAFDADADGALDEEEFGPWFNTHPSEAYREGGGSIGFVLPQLQPKNWPEIPFGKMVRIGTVYKVSQHNIVLSTLAFLTAGGLELPTLMSTKARSTSIRYRATCTCTYMANLYCIK